MHASSSNDLSLLEDSLGYTFKRKSLLKEAITHKSYAHEQQKKRPAFNERMEFLGDAVLELIVSEHLYSMHKDYTEADLSKVKAYVVQERTLAEIAKNLKVGRFLLLGKGEEITGGRKKPSLLANAFEAILAAIYLDGGYRKAKNFIIDNLSSKIQGVISDDIIFDFKTALQEVSQSLCGVLPKYETFKEEGPEHQKMFEVKVFIKEDLFGSGRGRTKKSAAQKAAEAALEKIRSNNETDL